MVVSSAVSASYLAVDITDDEHFATVIDHHVKVDMTTAVQTAHLTTTNGSLLFIQSCLPNAGVFPSIRISKTVQKTTGCGVRNIANPTLSQSFLTNNCMLRYCCLHHTIFSDTIFANTQSRHSNKCAQIFSSNFGWSQVYPMKTKGEANNSAWGCPTLMVMDSLKEQTLGKLAVTRRPQILTPHGRIPLNKRSRNSRKGLAETCSLPTHP